MRTNRSEQCRYRAIAHAPRSTNEMNKYTLILILVSQALSAGAPELKPIESVSPENHFKHTSGFLGQK
jgi:hypothetical protein